MLNPDHRTEGFCFHLIGCPIARHARAHGYDWYIGDKSPALENYKNLEQI